MATFLDTSINYEKLTKLKIKFSKGTNDKRIFHYTSIMGLKSILENSTLRFTNISYLNDKDEIKVGLKTLKKLIDSPEGEFMKIEESIRILSQCGTIIQKKLIIKDIILNLMINLLLKAY